MRAGACAPQQTLSAEAASVLKHSLTLARRRGHAQVTPLHVAATLLTSSGSILRRACLKSHHHHHHHHHPLQCRALELCFNVALNRLPAAPGPLLHAQPSLSNALVAVLKRAQAHQRRGCIEQQQQPLIAVKVEHEQLILSILDDPSVSRVMREAGFSSTSVKNNLEECNLVSSVFQCGGIYSAPSSPPIDSNRYPIPSWQYYGKPEPPQLLYPNSTNQDDVRVVLQVLLGKNNNGRRNAVIISDSSFVSETIISDLMQKVERGADIPDELKSTQLVKFQFSAVPLMFMNKEEVETNVMDLKRKVDSLSSKGGVIIYIGDLKWAVDESVASTGGGNNYNPIDHLIVEIGKLVSFYKSCIRVWLIATANYQTYIKCEMKQPSLDVQWALQAVSVPSGRLGLSLNATSGRRDNSSITYSENSSPVSEKKLFCLEDDADALTCCQECISNYDKEAASPQLPYWLNSHTHAPLQKEDLDQLRRKYNKLCQSLHQGSQNPHNSSWNHYSYPFLPNKKTIFSDSETISFLNPSPKLNRSPSSLPRFRRQQSCHIEFSFSNNQTEEPNLDSLKNKEEKITLALGNSTYTKSADLYSVFKENVPWQSATFPLIIDALKEDCKLVLMQGKDRVGKRRLAVSIAECILGSSEFLVCMNMRTGGKTGGENREILEAALKNRERVVVLLEDVDFADPLFLAFVFDGVKGRRDDMFLFTMGGDVRSEEEANNLVIPMRVLVGPPNVDHKRKAEWDLIERGFKGKRGNEIEEVSSNSIMNQIRELKRNLSTNGLDLNIKVDEDQESSPIEENNTSLGLVSKIKNRVVLNLDSDQESEAKEMLLMKLRRAFREFSGGKSVSNFNVDETVLEEILKGAGWYLNGLFEEWLKDIFQMSFNGVNNGEGETVSFRLCLGEKGEYGAKDGFKGTCLPKRIPVCFIG